MPKIFILIRLIGNDTEFVQFLEKPDIFPGSRDLYHSRIGVTIREIKSSVDDSLKAYIFAFVLTTSTKHFRTNMSLIIPGTFQHILRVMNTNIDGKRNIMFAITAIKGVGRRYANLVLKKVRPILLPLVRILSCHFLCC